MRCLSCNVELTDKEAVRKAPSGFYVDLCNKCFKESELSEIMLPTYDEICEEEEGKDSDDDGEVE